MSSIVPDSRDLITLHDNDFDLNADGLDLYYTSVNDHIIPIPTGSVNFNGNGNANLHGIEKRPLNQPSDTRTLSEFTNGVHSPASTSQTSVGISVNIASAGMKSDFSVDIKDTRGNNIQSNNYSSVGVKRTLDGEILLAPTDGFSDTLRSNTANASISSKRTRNKSLNRTSYLKSDKKVFKLDDNDNPDFISSLYESLTREHKSLDLTNKYLENEGSFTQYMSPVVGSASRTFKRETHWLGDEESNSGYSGSRSSGFRIRNEQKKYNRESEILEDNNYTMHTQPMLSSGSGNNDKLWTQEHKLVEYLFNGYMKTIRPTKKSGDVTEVLFELSLLNILEMVSM